MKRQKQIASEHQEQVALIEWGKLQGIPFVKIANEGKRSLIAGRLAKQEGLSSGFPDLICPRATLAFSVGFVEMKQNRKYTDSEKNKPLWKKQLAWIDYLNTQSGYYAIMAFGWHHAVTLLEHFYFTK